MRRRSCLQVLARRRDCSRHESPRCHQNDLLEFRSMGTSLRRQLGEIRFGIFRPSHKLRVRNLDGDRPAQLLIPREIDNTETAFSQEFLNQIAADPLRQAVRGETLPWSMRRRFGSRSIEIVHGRPSSVRAVSFAKASANRNRRPLDSVAIRRRAIRNHRWRPDWCVPECAGHHEIGGAKGRVATTWKCR